MAKISSLKTESRVSSQNKIDEVRAFLSENYEIRVNRFDPNPNRAVIKPKSKRFEYGVTWEEISIHMIEEGVQCSDTVLRKLLRSPNYMTTYNPVTEYFESLREKWKGVSHIDLLAAHLSIREYGDQGRDYYKIRFYSYLKKWLVATVACAMKSIANSVFLGLVHQDEGIGKTFFFEFLMPPVLRPYLAISKDDINKFDVETAFAQNMMILFDELVGVTKRSNEILKKVSSQSTIQVLLPRDPFPKEMPRLGSGCFTSNKTPEMGGFITSGMGYRRWLVIELESINQEYSMKVDVDQLWAEAVTLMEQDFDYTWHQSDWEEFRMINERYRVETSCTKYIRMYFRKPINGEGEWMQANEVLNCMIEKKLIRSEDRGSMSNEAIGRALTQLGFDRKKVRRGIDSIYAYHVCHLDSL
jgi:predicted P-loop ATPase